MKHFIGEDPIDRGHPVAECDFHEKNLQSCFGYRYFFTDSSTA
jgi:hypothetical protein